MDVAASPPVSRTNVDKLCSPSPWGNKTYDWPLSKVEKKEMLVRISASELQSYNAEVQHNRIEMHRLQHEIGMRRASKESCEAPPPHMAQEAEKLTHDANKDALSPRDQDQFSVAAKGDAVQEALSRRLSFDSTASTSVSGQQSHRSSRGSTGSSHGGGEAPQVKAVQEAITKLLVALEEAKRNEAKLYEEEEPFESRKSRSVPRHLDAPTPLSALKGGRRSRSRGGQDEKPSRISFVDGGSSGSDREDMPDDTSQPLRGRLARRVSRGPDGRPYSIGQEKSPKEPEADNGSGSNGSGSGSIAKAVAGGVGGLTAGAVIGTVVALPAALFTFGLSIPLGATFGSGVGMYAGSSYGYKWKSGGGDCAPDP